MHITSYYIILHHITSYYIILHHEIKNLRPANFPNRLSHHNSMPTAEMFHNDVYSNTTQLGLHADSAGAIALAKQKHLYKYI